MPTDHENNERAQRVMQGFRFGIEIETIGAPRFHNGDEYRTTIAQAINNAINDGVHAGAMYAGGYYRRQRVVDGEGHWDVMTDGSISSSVHGEIVSPILTFDDIGKLQTIVRASRRAGARVNRSCGIHVHVGLDGEFRDPGAVARLARFIYTQEELLLAAVSPNTYRYNGIHGCPVRRIPKEAFLDRLPRRVRKWRELAQAWYGEFDPYLSRFPWCEPGTNRDHYHSTRYRGLNLHAVWNKGTVEFRYFDATLHAGKVRAYLMLCLALCARAVVSRSAIARKRPFTLQSAAYDWRIVMNKIYLRGDRHKTVRKHLLAPIKEFGFSSSSARTGKSRGGVTSDRIYVDEAESHIWTPTEGR